MEPSEKKIRSLFITYEATEEAAEIFNIVLGSVAENFRGVEVVEFDDSSSETEKQESEDFLNEWVLRNSLSEEQLQEIADFSKRVSDWQGELKDE